MPHLKEEIFYLTHYRDEEILWNPGHKHSRHLPSILEAWERISEETGLSVEEFRRMRQFWNFGYEMYLKEFEKYKAQGKIYKSRWINFDFFHAFVGPVYDPDKVEKTLTSDVRYILSRVIII